MRHTHFGRTSLGLTLAVVLVGGSQIAQASFHLMQIEQVIGGVNGDTTAQAVQLRLRFFGQNFVSQARLVAYDSAGANPVVLIDFTTDVSQGGLGDRILIASPNFANYTSVPLSSDFIMTSLIPASYLAAGRITFEDDFGTIYWSLSFGGSGYTGPTDGEFDNDSDGEFGPPFPGPLPTNGFDALKFKGSSSAISNNNAADYALTVGGAVFVNNNGNSAAVTCPPVPTVNIAASDPTGSEPGANTARFTLTRMGCTNSPLTVKYMLGGTATPGIDYSNVTGRVKIPVGKLSANVVIKPIDDVMLECPETVVATIVLSTNYHIGPLSNAVVAITDNELPTVRVTALDGTASEPGVNKGQFRVSRTGCTNLPLQVSYGLGGTATPGIDYSNLTGRVTIPVGKLVATVAVKPIDDTVVEVSETVIVAISNRPTYLISAPGNATVTINDND